MDKFEGKLSEKMSFLVAATPFCLRVVYTSVLPEKDLEVSAPADTREELVATGVKLMRLGTDSL